MRENLLPSKKLPYSYKLVSTVLSILLTILLAQQAYTRILVGLTTEPTTDDARVATVVATCALAAAVVRLVPALLPDHGWKRLVTTFIFSIIAAGGVIFISWGLNAPLPGMQFLIVTVILMLLPMFEDLAVICMKDEKPVEDEKPSANI